MQAGASVFPTRVVIVVFNVKFSGVFPFILNVSLRTPRGEQYTHEPC